MLVPRFLFGTSREVRSSVGKALTQLKRGATLKQLSEGSGYQNLAEHPESLVWMQTRGGFRSPDERDYRASMFTEALFNSRRVPFTRSNEIREQSAEFLSRSPWGTLLMNTDQGGVWHNELPLRPFRPCRTAYIAVVAGTLEHWDAIMAFGDRYYSGLGGVPFPQTLPGYGVLFDELGIAPAGAGQGWKPIRDLCGDGVLLERLRHDDAFWVTFVRRAQSRWKTPELVPENLEEIVRLCAQGSGERTQWNFVRQQLGENAVEQALEKLVAGGDNQALMFALVHGLADLHRAAQLYERTSDGAIRWAGPAIAEYLADFDPARAVEIYFELAGHQAHYGRRAAEEVVDLLSKARSLLTRNREHDWQSRLALFMKTHARQRSVVAALRAAYM